MSDTTDLFFLRIVICYARLRVANYSVVALHRRNGDSPADLAAATNSRTFEGNVQRASATFPFQQTRKPSTKRLLTIGGRASTLFQKINEVIGTVAVDPKLVKKKPATDYTDYLCDLCNLWLALLLLSWPDKGDESKATRDLEV